MQITQFTKQDLISLPESDKFWSQKNISGEKLKFLLENPILGDSDFVLFTGEENDQVVSYLTVCPEIVKLDKQKTKIYWFNSWWVDPAFQASGIAGFLFFKAWETLDKKIAVASFSRKAEQFYNRIGKFDLLKNKTRDSIFLNLDINLMLLKFSILKYLSFLLKIIRIPLLACYYFNKLIIDRLLQKNNIDIKQVDKFDDTLWEFIKGKTLRDLVIKSKRYFKWKLKNHVCYMVLLAGVIVGFVAIGKIVKNQKSLINNALRIEYFLSDAHYNKMLALSTISLAYKLKCSRIVTESEEFSALLNKYRFFWLFKISQIKKAIISKSFHINSDLVQNKNIHLGDGG